MWMGDLEAKFMEKIKGEIAMDPADILFAPHHGRESGTVPAEWLEQMQPKLIVIGEAPSETRLGYVRRLKSLVRWWEQSKRTELRAEFNPLYRRLR